MPLSQSVEEHIGNLHLRRIFLLDKERHVLKGVSPFHLRKRRFSPPVLYNVKSPNQVLYLPGFPGQGSTIKDYSGNGNDGTITGATWVRNSQGVWGVSVPGETTANIDLPSDLEAAAGTLELWLKWQSSAVAQGHAGYIAADMVYQHNANDQIYLAGGAMHFVYVPPLEEIHHWRFTWTDNTDSATCNLYIDDVVQTIAASANYALAGIAKLLNFSTPDATRSIKAVMYSARVYDAVVDGRYAKERHLFGG